MLTIWVIDEGSLGHLSQSAGLAEGLAKITPSQIVIIRGRSKLRGWQRPFVQWMMGKQGKPLPSRLLKRVVDLKIPEQVSSPDLIISSGGKSVFAARTLSRQHRAPYVYIGERKPFPAAWFDLVLSPVPGESSSNSLDIELIPTPVSPQTLMEHGFVQPDTWCMIVGGASRSHLYEVKDWVSLACQMNDIALRESIRWCVTTSRRTGKRAESLIRDHLDPKFLNEAVWWSDETKDKSLQNLMAMSEVLFVTQDSITMVTEAVSAGKPTVVVRPDVTSFRGDSFLPCYYDRLETQRRVIRTTVQEMHQVSKSELESLSTLKEPYLETIAREALERLCNDGLINL